MGQYYGIIKAAMESMGGDEEKGGGNPNYVGPDPSTATQPKSTSTQKADVPVYDDYSPPAPPPQPYDDYSPPAPQEASQPYMYDTDSPAWYEKPQEEQLAATGGNYDPADLFKNLFEKLAAKKDDPLTEIPKQNQINADQKSSYKTLPFNTDYF